ncbi:MAG TPA: hypothetical protein VD866_19330, partial [Urbifossiella sp.]|nr:hypothetical protein [Urbifossiella sp.]
VFPYRAVQPQHAGPALLPLLPVRLARGVTALADLALVDSGSTVNVLPLDLGRRLGLDWAAHQITIQLGGNLANHPAKAVVLDVTVAGFPLVRLAFAWSSHPDARLILGQTNFFGEFDICFFRSRGEFHVQPRTP